MLIFSKIQYCSEYELDVIIVVINTCLNYYFCSLAVYTSWFLPDGSMGDGKT